MEIVLKKIDELIPYEKNPRINDEAAKYVAESIRQFGFKVPMVIDKDNVIVAGHTRFKAAKELGMAKVPCIVADDLTEEQVKAFRIADNKVGEVASWDYAKLGEELASIDGIKMEDFGFLKMESMNFDNDFDDVQESEQKPKMVKCPFCGEKFEKGQS